jgi:hypothetical protein
MVSARVRRAEHDAGHSSGLEDLGRLSQRDRDATAGRGNLDPALPVTEGGIDDEREAERLGVERDRFVSIADGDVHSDDVR